MKKKRQHESQNRWGWKAPIAGLVALGLIVGLSLTPYLSDRQAKQESCQASLSLHPIRVLVYNEYRDPVWIQIEYSGIAATETWVLGGGESDTIYTNHGYPLGANATVTFRAVDPTTRKLLADEPVVFELRTGRLVYDSEYHSSLLTQKRITTLSASDLECVTEQVFEGPTIVFG